MELVSCFHHAKNGFGMLLNYMEDNDMKVLLIDDHGEIVEVMDDGNVVMEAAKDHYFHPCGWCGQVCFVGEGNDDETCKYCQDQGK